MHTHTYSESLINVSLLCLSSSPHPSFLPFFCPLLSHSLSSSIEPLPVCDPSNPTFTPGHFQLPVQHLYCKVNGCTVSGSSAWQSIEQFHEQHRFQALLYGDRKSQWEEQNSCMGEKRETNRPQHAAAPQGGVWKVQLSLLLTMKRLISLLAELWTCSLWQISACSCLSAPSSLILGMKSRSHAAVMTPRCAPVQAVTMLAVNLDD